MRKIALLVNTWTNDHFTDMMAGIKDYIEDLDVRIDVFNSYSVSTDPKRSKNELTIHRLPLHDEYDSLIIFINTESDNKELLDIINEFTKQNKPAICLDTKLDVLPFIGIDNYASEYALIEHMILEHNCKTFQFVGGLKSFPDNSERYRAFVDCLHDYNIPIDQRYVSHRSFMESTGTKAFEHIYNADLPIPDAVICANDYIAIGYCTAAQKKGFYAPNDYKLCGFDNIFEAQKYYPSITSMNKNIYSLVQESIRLVLNACDGTPIPEKSLIPGILKMNDSCGCNNHRNMIDAYKQAIREERSRDLADIQQRDSRGTLCACKSFDALQSALYINQHTIGLYETALCIKDDINGDKCNLSDSCHSDHMTCYTATGLSSIHEGQSIFPSEWLDRDEKVFLYSPLYYDSDIFGYCVMPYDNTIYTKRFHEAFLDSISIAIENIRQKALIDTMNQRFKDLYIMDQMTGLYNRFGYASLAKEAYEKYSGLIYLVFIDMNKLKMFNDRYGHGAGDIGIKGIAECMKKVFTDTHIHVRMGGDEFLVIGQYTSIDDLLNKEEQLLIELERYSVKHHLPIALSASIGHSFNATLEHRKNLDTLLKIADQQMYKVKQAN